MRGEVQFTRHADGRWTWMVFAGNSAAVGASGYARAVAKPFGEGEFKTLRAARENLATVIRIASRCEHVAVKPGKVWTLKRGRRR